MRFTDLSTKNDSDFKRFTGVSPKTFQEMLDAYTHTKRNFGRPTKLPYADQLLLALMYWRENRTLFHIGQAYQVSESYACKIVHAVEEALLADARFHLPGKKSLLGSAKSGKVALLRLDVTETPILDKCDAFSIQRPQKDRSGSTVARRSGTR